MLCPILAFLVFKDVVHWRVPTHHHFLFGLQAKVLSSVRIPQQPYAKAGGTVTYSYHILYAKFVSIDMLH